MSRQGGYCPALLPGLLAEPPASPLGWEPNRPPIFERREQPLLGWLESRVKNQAGPEQPPQ
jgi:hypothetical protein